MAESGQHWQKHQGQRLAQPAVSRQLCDKSEHWVNDSGTNGASINNWHSGSHNIVQPNVTCYVCGKPGHKKPQCPDIIRRVKSPSRLPPIIAEELIAGKRCSKLLVDTGADKSVVRADCVPKECFTGKSVVLGSYNGKRPQTHPTTLLQFDIGPVKGTFEVAVARLLDQDALLGSELGVDAILKLACQVRETYRERSVEETLLPQSVIRETRTGAQVAKEREEQAADDLATVT